MKDKAIIRVSGTDVSGDSTGVDFTSDAVRVDNFSGIVLTFFADSLTVSGQSPTLTVEVSGSTDVDSFVEVFGAIELDLTVAEPSVVLQDFSIEVDFVRFIYSSEGATGGTLAYELRKI